MTLNSKKHLYVFRIKCEQCGKLYNMKLELYEYMEPEWLIKSVPIKNICKRCNVKREVKSMIKDMINRKLSIKKFGTESLLLDVRVQIEVLDGPRIISKGVPGCAGWSIVYRI